MMNKVQDLQAKASEARRELVRLEGEERKSRMHWEQVQRDLTKMRETLSRAEYVRDANGGAPEIPLPSYNEMLRLVEKQCPDKTHQERVAMVAQLRSGFAGSNIGAGFQKAHGHVSGPEVVDMSENSYSIPSPTERFGPIGQTKNYGVI
jgi:hypothetical protein